MKINADVFYILVEGEPTSIETSFFDRAIENLKSEDKLGRIRHQIIQVGGCSAFNTIAKLIYDSHLEAKGIHWRVPVLAIGDRDYRDEVADQNDLTDFKQYINSKKAKIIYWSMHEWENFLLADFRSIVDVINNKIPLKGNPKYPSSIIVKTQDRKIDIEELEHYLESYFSEHLLLTEIFECVKFFLKENGYPNNRVRFQLNISERWESLNELRESIKNQINEFTEICQKQCKETTDHRQQISKDILLKMENRIDTLDSQMKNCRGKEAWNHIAKYIQQTLGLKDQDGLEVSNAKLTEYILLEFQYDDNFFLKRNLLTMLRPYFEYLQ